MAYSSGHWVHKPSPNPGASLRLFCFPFAGGTAQSFRGWAEGLPTSVEVCPVQLPGRETRMREPAFSEAKALVDAMAPAIVEHLNKPFALFGHSMGAIVAFELARKLRKEYAQDAECLIVSGRVAPHLRPLRPPMHGLPKAEFIEALTRLNGTPEDVLRDEELMEMILPLLRADFAVHEAYTFVEEPRLQCPILAFGGLQDTEASREGLAGWREHTALSFTQRMLPGDHFFIVKAKALFLRMLSQELYPIAKRI